MEKSNEEKVVHKHFWQTSDFLAAVAVTIGFWVEINSPTSFNFEYNIIAGIIVWVLGLWIIFETKQDFKKHKQKTSPGHAPDTLITSGAFKYSRNPTYVAIIIIVLGFSILFDSRWLVLSAPLAAGLIHFVLIRPEEKFLEAEFGDAYRDYKKKVRRWL